MSYENPHKPHEELVTDPLAVANLQRDFGNQWGDLYSNAEEPPVSAEVTLRNPAVYLRDVNVKQLPEGLQKQWDSVNRLAEAVLDVASQTETEWDSQASALEKLQGRVRSGELDPEYRGAVGSTIKAASAAFAESSKVIPGNTKYYAGNVAGMRGWLERAQAHA